MSWGHRHPEGLLTTVSSTLVKLEMERRDGECYLLKVVVLKVCSRDYLEKVCQDSLR